MLDHIHQATTERDFNIAFQMAMRFAENSPYKKFIDPNTISNIIVGAMKSKDAIVLLCGEMGMIVVMMVPFIYGEVKMAVELAWWVEPIHRASKVGTALWNAAEVWAKANGAVGMTMISLDDEVGKVYEKYGYELKERTYFKEL